MTCKCGKFAHDPGCSRPEHSAGLVSSPATDHTDTIRRDNLVARYNGKKLAEMYLLAIKRGDQLIGQREQAIDALREVYESNAIATARMIARAALLSLGEQP